MTRQEIVDKIAELNKQLEEMDKSVGYKNDNIFLLSDDEYEKYKNVIPEINVWWWLRSSGYNTNYSECVYGSGGINDGGLDVRSDGVGIRLALKIDTSDYKVGDKFAFESYSFTVIDKNLAIATVPIAFDKFDDNINDYENSYIRKWLLEWGRGGKNDNSKNN